MTTSRPLTRLAVSSAHDLSDDVVNLVNDLLRPDFVTQKRPTHAVLIGFICKREGMSVVVKRLRFVVPSGDISPAGLESALRIAKVEVDGE